MAKPTHTDEELRKLEDGYNKLASTLSKVSSELIRQVTELLDANSIAVGLSPECRVKAWDKIPEKLDRESLHLRDIKDLNDLIGLRFVLLFKRDLEPVFDLIERNFVVHRKYDTQERLGDDRFGYASVHYIVGLKDDWLAIPSLTKGRDIKIEIQVRTLSQHIWAAASHKLQYKDREGVPAPVRRSLSRVSALLETVDLEFERVLAERERYRQEASTRTPESKLNVDLLEKILDVMLPKENKSKSEDYAELLDDLLYFNVDTIGQLYKVLTMYLPQALEEEKRVLGMAKRKELNIMNDPDGSRLTRGVILTHAGITRLILGLHEPSKQEQLRYVKMQQRLVSAAAPTLQKEKQPGFWPQKRAN